MPFQGERASKASHYDLIENVDVAQFLAECSYLRQPSKAEAAALATLFRPVSPPQTTPLPERVLAVDGSYYESSLNDQIPSTKVGYVKIGCVLIDMVEFGSLRVDSDRFVDPFRVAKMQQNNDALTFPLPSANIQWKGIASVRDGFRAAVDAYLDGPNTRFERSNPATSLRSTLFNLAALRPTQQNAPSGALLLHRCPSCNTRDVPVYDVPTTQVCPACQSVVYPSDCLRAWEAVTEYQSNATAIARFMLDVEHLLPIHYIRYLTQHSLAALGQLAFFVDGPLAVFGEGAWLHAAIMRYLVEVNRQLAEHGLARLLMIGLQKTGQVVDHVNVIRRFIPRGAIMAIDDAYRSRYILAAREPANNGFGYETYYGQDFIYHSAEGSTFVFALPYPFAAKTGLPGGLDFVRAKVELVRYPELYRALKLIDHFRCDLYSDALVPLALAHHYTAISLVPGGRVLDLLTRQAMSSRVMPNTMP